MIKKLSICMIVKDEEKNLDRCLNSLKPILNKEYIELIIVDTGSTDQTINIAKNYTEHVFFHEWNGNFSDMRNISLSYATGEWIFIVDADEELDTPEEFISLVENSQLNLYNTVRITNKSLLSLKANKYVYHVQERFFRNDGTFKYRGSIHNQPGYKHPVLTIKDIQLLHYGYDNEDKELMEKKFTRTATMLKKELEKDPQNIYCQFQLSRSYAMHGNQVTGLDEMTKAYQTLKRQSKDVITQSYYVFGEYARMSLNLKKYQQVIDICNEGLIHSKYYLDLYYYLGHAYLSLDENKKGISALEKYLEFYEKYFKNELDLSNFTAVEMYTLDDDTYLHTMQRIMTTLYKDHSLNCNFVKYKFWINKLQNDIVKNRLSVQLLMIKKDYNGLLGVYQCIKDDKHRYSFVNDIETIKKDLEIEEKERIETIFSTIVEDDYSLLNRIRLTENRRKLLMEFINKYNIIEFTDEVIIEFISYLIKSNCLNRYFKKVDSVTIKKIVKVLIDKENRKDYFMRCLRYDFKFNDFQNNRVYIAIANVLLFSIIAGEAEKQKFNEEVQRIFTSYINRGLDYVEFIYNIEKIRLTYSTLQNKEDKFFILLYLADKAIGKEDYVNFKKYILQATNEYPFLSGLLNMYVSDKIVDLDF